MPSKMKAAMQRHHGALSAMRALKKTMASSSVPSVMDRNPEGEGGGLDGARASRASGVGDDGSQASPDGATDDGSAGGSARSGDGGDGVGGDVDASLLKQLVAEGKSSGAVNSKSHRKKSGHALPSLASVVAKAEDAAADNADDPNPFSCDMHVTVDDLRQFDTWTGDHKQFLVGFLIRWRNMAQDRVRGLLAVAWGSWAAAAKRLATVEARRKRRQIHAAAIAALGATPPQARTPAQVNGLVEWARYFRIFGDISKEQLAHLCQVQTIDCTKQS